MENEVVLPTNGILKKWTNYMGGWQDRYFEIIDGNLVYYKSKNDKSFGCRGSIFLKNAIITANEFDECEFSISMGENVQWFLKAENSHSKLLWMRSVVRETIQSDSDYSSTSTKSHSRNPSVSSAILPKTDEDPTKTLTTKLSELEAYRTMCKDQMASIERLLEQGGASCIVPQPSILSIKATHLALIVNINHIVELVKSSKVVLGNDKQHKELLCAKESIGGMEKEDCYASDDNSTIVARNQDLDVTSDCDEFYDADEFEARSIRSTSPVSTPPAPETPAKPEFQFRHETPHTGHYDNLEVSDTHNLYSKIDKLALDQLKYALAGVEDNVWTLFAEDGPMKMYTRQIEDEGGLPVDPLKATHCVKGVTALEFMHYFYDARYKMQWDHTLDSMSVVENISSDAVVLHQKHKTVWPAAPRESLFVSHIRRVDHMKRDGAHDLYIVCNTDIKRPDVPLGSSSSVRVGLTVSMICETIVKNPEKSRKLTRDDVTCNIIYVSQVHPGGWVPTAALRHVYKKEYPKFLRTFTEFVQKNVAGKPNNDMKTVQKYVILVLLLLFVFLIWEENNIGSGYVYWANRYQNVILKNITVIRNSTSKINIGIVIILQTQEDESKYKMALDTVKCYAQYFNYDLHIVKIDENYEAKQKCQHSDFMFRRHCVLSYLMFTSKIANDWVLFVDADMAVINPNNLIEKWVLPYSSKDAKTNIIFYNRIMNHEVMAGSYLVKNTKWSQDFLMFWANYQQKLPHSFHGTDNGAIHSVIIEYCLPDKSKQREFCENKFWKTSRNYHDLSEYEICCQNILNSTKMEKVEILRKGRFSWARDGWLSNSLWSDQDFIVHGWQERRKDKLIFAMWHSPLIDSKFDLSLCSTSEAHKNWKYKDTFYTTNLDVNRRITSFIQNLE
ncbi:unnamed protein product [Caenorhabditis angaria]|uniref:Ceramide transfer protein n=1 Tax=Caenorhabditis angaria TaxID=860376 RepID=A0A9P1I0M1_9PELO|nr:unnamed protein product [Caenorhabditis angaria]